jgi:uncharacterized protein YbdZ (MbtH family)
VNQRGPEKVIALWSGRVVDRAHWVETRQIDCGEIRYAVYDIERSTTPRCAYWPVHQPVPPGWQIVRYCTERAALEVVPRVWAPPIRIYVLVRAYAAWLNALRERVRVWWAMRPPLRIWRG